MPDVDHVAANEPVAAQPSVGVPQSITRAYRPPTVTGLAQAQLPIQRSQSAGIATLPQAREADATTAQSKPLVQRSAESPALQLMPLARAVQRVPAQRQEDPPDVAELQRKAEQPVRRATQTERKPAREAIKVQTKMETPRIQRAVVPESGDSQLMAGTTTGGSREQTEEITPADLETLAQQLLPRIKRLVKHERERAFGR